MSIDPSKWDTEGLVDALSRLRTDPLKPNWDGIAQSMALVTESYLLFKIDELGITPEELKRDYVLCVDSIGLPLGLVLKPPQADPPTKLSDY